MVLEIWFLGSFMGFDVSIVCCSVKTPSRSLFSSPFKLLYLFFNYFLLKHYAIPKNMKVLTFDCFFFLSQPLFYT